MKKKVVAIIPARMAASRFPGKPLAKILDLPMIEHVRRRALLCKALDEVHVATCDQEIFDVVSSYGGRAIMTRDTHLRCTDRVKEAMGHVKADIVVILQGDEPLFDGLIVEKLVRPLHEDSTLGCANLLTPIRRPQDLQDADIVKALLDVQGNILYFSRAPVPYVRARHPHQVFRQTGLSAFSADFLKTFSALTPTPLEITESVDFLRILEHRFRIKAVIHEGESAGVDRYDDIAIVEEILQQDKKQREFYAQILQLK